MLIKDDNLEFLANKIQEIKIASFRAEKDVSLQFPANMVSTLKTDSDGNIWFFTHCNAAISRSFFAHLLYHQKDQDCSLRISGKASIYNNGSEAFNYTIDPGLTVNT